MSKVVLVRCESYDYNEVRQAVGKGLDLLGGASKFAKPGEKILLKPNLLAGDPPEKCTTTHPSVFKAVIECFKATQAEIRFGDSPGMGINPSGVARSSGLLDTAAQEGIMMGDFNSGKEVTFNSGVFVKKFLIANGVLESDAIISLPKMKNHAFMRFTGAVKNQFGCIPGLTKGEYHVTMADPRNFAKMLVDLNRFVKPRLFIMDGIMAMEGNGPRGGSPKKMNVLLFSTDPVALDAVACRMIGIKPDTLLTNFYGKEAGLGTYLDDDIEIAGDNLESFISKDFQIIEAFDPASRKGIVNFIDKLLVSRPYIVESKCVRCGICVKACPVNPKAVDWHSGDKTKPPSYKYDRCIKCFCCQEMCPEHAIRVKVPFIRWLFSKKGNNK